MQQLKRHPKHLAIAMLIAMAAAEIPSKGDAAGSTACEPYTHKAVAELIERWQRHAGHADVDRLASLYGDDAVLTTAMPGEAFRGRDAIGNHLRGLLARHPMGSVVESMVIVGCDRALSSGRILLRVTGARKGTRMLLAGRFELKLAARDGRWQIIRHDLVLDPRPNRIDATTFR